MSAYLGTETRTHWCVANVFPDGRLMPIEDRLSEAEAVAAADAHQQSLEDLGITRYRVIAYRLDRTETRTEIVAPKGRKGASDGNP